MLVCCLSLYELFPIDVNPERRNKAIFTITNEAMEILA